MLVIGIDPGIGITGYGLVRETEQGLQTVDFGVIRTEVNGQIDLRLLDLSKKLKEILFLHKPDSAAVEKLFFQRNVSTALTVGQARGVAMLALAEDHIPISEYGPKEIKLAITGYGGADKKQIQNMVATLLGMKSIPKPDDAADALAVAICHLHRSQTLLTQEGSEN
jgi:crossover junction endodeoxyribonuclease RuvC